jgi:N-acyl homoserine lactone hydrolase
MKLYVFDAGRVHLPDKNHLTPDRNVGVPVTMPILMFLIDHPKGLVVFDTGIDTDAVTDPLLETGPERRIDRQMLRLGYDPAAVKYVVLSHLHFDHMECATLFPDATFVVRRQELRAAWWPDAYERGYNFDMLLKTRTLKYLQVADHVDFDLFGDGSLVLIDTKGHTEGHQSLVVDLAESGTIVLVGDAVQVDDNLTYRVPPGVSWSSQYAVQTMDRLEHLRDLGALLIFGHEIALLDRLKVAPECYC